MQTELRTESARGSLLAPKSDPKAMKILAGTLFNDMVANGLSHEQIIGFATELLARVTDDLKGSRAPSE